jgi:hypothetical protein
MTVSRHNRAVSARTVTFEPFTHSSDSGVRIGYELLQGLEIGEDVAPIVDTSLSLSCPRHSYSVYRFSMNDRVAQPILRTFFE